MVESKPLGNRHSAQLLHSVSILPWFSTTNNLDFNAFCLEQIYSDQAKYQK